MQLIFLLDQQSGHASPNTEGLREAALPVDPAARLRTRGGEDHYFQGTSARLEKNICLI